MAAETGQEVEDMLETYAKFKPFLERTEPARRKRSKKALLFILLSIVVLIVVIVTVFLLTKGGDHVGGGAGENATMPNDNETIQSVYFKRETAHGSLLPNGGSSVSRLSPAARRTASLSTRKGRKWRKT